MRASLRMTRSRSSYVSLVTTLFLYPGTSASTTYPSRQRGPPHSTFSRLLIIVTNAFRIYSHSYRHIIGSRGCYTSLPTLRRIAPCYQRPTAPYISIPARGRFCLLPVRYRRFHASRSRHVQHLPVHSRLAHLMRRLTFYLFFLPFSPLFLAFSRHVSSVVAALFTHTNAQKHAENPRKPHTSHSPFSRFL
ncbi:hypothetical protein C2E23DRAFT_111303 [Lenzites betulinus]|nr:hypothetical protein C2E23DRAFT_111303 [Lenzites betulinus]